MKFYPMKLTDNATGAEVSFYASSETCKTDKQNQNIITSFDGYVGEANGEPHFVHFVLSNTKSQQYVTGLSIAFSSASTTAGAARGFVKGASDAVRQGPTPMRAAALQGAAKGFVISAVIAGGMAVLRHKIQNEGNATPDLTKILYYVSPHYETVFKGPLYLLPSAKPVDV